MPKVDKRYLKRRSQVWYFNKRVTGTAKWLQQSLGTKDLKEAMIKRDQILEELKVTETEITDARAIRDIRGQYLQASSDLEREYVEDIARQKAEDIAVELGVQKILNGFDTRSFEELSEDEKKPIEFYRKATAKIHVFQDYLEDYVTTRGSKSEQRKALRALQLLMKRFACVEEVDWPKADQYLQTIGEIENVHKDTVTRWLSIYRGFWRHVKKDGDLTVWDNHRIPHSKESKKDRLNYEHDEIVRVVRGLRQSNTAVSDWLIHPVIIALHTGARLDAIADMTYNHKDQTILFPRRKYEKRDRVVPAHKNIIKNCIAWENKRRAAKTIGNRYSYFKKTLGFSDRHYDFHGFRHTFCTELDRLNVPLNVIQSIVGHKNKDTDVTSKHYIKRSLPEQMREAVHKLSYPTEIYQ